MANKFQSILDEKVLNERGQALGLVKRKRLVTPFQFFLASLLDLSFCSAIHLLV
jgi:hypothetical protein